MMMLFVVMLVSRAEKNDLEGDAEDAQAKATVVQPSPMPTAEPSPVAVSSTSVVISGGAVDELFQEFQTPEFAAIQKQVSIDRISDGSRKGLWVRILVKDVFASSSVEVDHRFLPSLDRIGVLFSKLPVDVAVEASANRDELIRKPYLSVWEFSAARAATIVQRWQKQNDFGDRRLSAVGRGYRARTGDDIELEFKVFERLPKQP